ncbi:unnamed protein product [Prorocentrum cordatum]|uniref:CinA C-terminal domain-containing protein n=1 Tax=Prorocentrum cordatum TaxID=2364126 RepID=A0ABN9S202_9DINO|nr:unnamed protein product [Polarella glacialis]
MGRCLRRASLCALRAAGQTVAAAEATSAGLVAACLQAVRGASAFWQGGVVIYSPRAAAALLPREVLVRLGSRRSNYSSPESYVRSKERCSPPPWQSSTGKGSPWTGRWRRAGRLTPVGCRRSCGRRELSRPPLWQDQEAWS